MSVRIVTDSAAGLSQEIVEQLQIQVLDLHVMDTEGEQSTSGLTSLELAAADGRQMERANDADATKEAQRE